MTDTLLWVDVETTAIRPEDGDLLEVELRHTNMQGDMLASFHEIIHPHTLHFDPVNKYALGLHNANGLLKACMNTNPTRDTEMVEDYLNEWVSETITDPQHCHLAGTNPQFDLDWIWYYLHTDFEREWEFNHRRLDLSGMRLTLQTVKMNPYCDAKHKTTHRTEDCLNRDLNEYRFYRAMLQEWENPNITEE